GMPHALVGADLDLALDVLCHLAAEVPFDLVRPVDELADPGHLLFGEVPHLPSSLDAGPLHDLEGSGRADPVDVAKGDVHPLVAGKVDACDPCHSRSLLPLPLLVPGVSADDPDPAVAADELARSAPVAHPRPHLHLPNLSLPCSGTRSCRASGPTATAP